MVATEAAAVEGGAWREGVFWEWRGMPVRYAVINVQGKGAPLLLVHGFGASLEHWRDNALSLAKDRPVYTIDLLGFGFSAQPDTPKTFNRWGGHVWATQICDFITDVMLPASATKKVILAGNSLGGYSALLATGAGVVGGGEIGGLVLVNSAGSFLPDDATKDPLADVARNQLLKSVDTEESSIGPIGIVLQALKRAISFGGFILTREGRIESTLKLVYTDDKSRVDDDLVDLIKRPAMQPNAFEVFFKTTLGGRDNTAVSINRLAKEVEESQIPSLLLWGENDPWITMKRAKKILDLMPSATFVPLTAGHCPHDEVPAQFNAKLLAWLADNRL